MHNFQLVVNICFSRKELEYHFLLSIVLSYQSKIKIMGSLSRIQYFGPRELGLDIFLGNWDTVLGDKKSFLKIKHKQMKLEYNFLNKSLQFFFYETKSFLQFINWKLKRRTILNLKRILTFFSLFKSSQLDWWWLF